VKFEHATGYKTAENMRTYDSRTYEGAYMAGVIAGKMTKTNTLGVVGSMPIPRSDPQHQQLHAGRAVGQPEGQDQGGVGQRMVQPAQGNRSRHRADQRRRRRAVPEHRLVGRAADRREMGKRAFGWDSDMTAYGPKAHLGSAVINWGPYYIKAVGTRWNGKWNRRQAWWGVKEGAIDMVSVAADVPDDAKKKVDEIKAGLKDGSFVIWKGPIVGQDGKEVLAKDAVADDKFLGGINFYVKGVEGKVPTLKAQ
jgi:basic membrane protein A